MAKIKNDPASYKKRSDFAQHGSKSAAGKITPSQQASLLRAIGTSGRSHVPIGALLRK